MEISHEMAFSTPTPLLGRFVQVVPLVPEHAPALVEAVQPGRLWETWYTSIPAPEEMAQEIAARLKRQSDGEIAAYAITLAEDSRPIGMTTYLHPDPQNLRVEIGSTWIGKQYQGGRVNAETKLLMLQHAFEHLECQRVELRAHHMNFQSRAAIEKLGAHCDGILRRHMLLPNGTWRDTVVYSILREEWPTVRAGLEARL
ncbi:GNAT family N-acetyltransferase [Corynebacterium kozikiae]|uniref:GNAT family N-acetyltransferase n=1 Tax=Corynebacterium kozikiae TaxID=2968469 RepID=UPI00211BFF99|nr:GNAT family N-acetyltransferase [Corynebacterium sp. 76QC2CO]